MSNDLVIASIAWLLVFAFFIVGMAFAIPYNREHFDPCWSCGKFVEKPNDYCTHCGADLTPVCVNCGAECTTAFCGACGTPISQEG